jgi:hypothetical protein
VSLSELLPSSLPLLVFADVCVADSAAAPTIIYFVSCCNCLISALTGFTRKHVKTRMPGRKRIELSPWLGRNWTMVAAVNFRGLVTCV